MFFFQGLCEGRSLRIHPQNLATHPWKTMVGRLVSFWENLFLGAILHLQVVLIVERHKGSNSRGSRGLYSHLQWVPIKGGMSLSPIEWVDRPCQGLECFFCNLLQPPKESLICWEIWVSWIFPEALTITMFHLVKTIDWKDQHTHRNTHYGSMGLVYIPTFGWFLRWI